MRKYLLINISLILVTLSACNKDPQPSDPGIVTLLSPTKDEACTSGKVLSDNENTVHFTWLAAENADTYGLAIKNLLTEKIELYATTKTEFDATLLRNTPYSWLVVSKSTNTENVGTSEIWKFYNSGLGTLAYAPYPAEIVSPLMGQNVTAATNKVSLEWIGSDVDNDIASYDVYFGTTIAPPLIKANLAVTKLSDISVTASVTYYWRIVSKDLKGNTSDSGVFQFTVK